MTLEQMSSSLCANAFDREHPEQAISALRSLLGQAASDGAVVPAHKAVARHIAERYNTLSNPELPSEPPNRAAGDPEFAAWLLVRGLNALVLDEPGCMERYEQFVVDSADYLKFS